MNDTQKPSEASGASGASASGVDFSEILQWAARVVSSGELKYVPPVCVEGCVVVIHPHDYVQVALQRLEEEVAKLVLLRVTLEARGQ